MNQIGGSGIPESMRWNSENAVLSVDKRVSSEVCVCVRTRVSTVVMAGRVAACCAVRPGASFRTLLDRADPRVDDMDVAISDTGDRVGWSARPVVLDANAIDPAFFFCTTMMVFLGGGGILAKRELD